VNYYDVYSQVYWQAFWATYGVIIFISGVVGLVISVIVAKAAERKGRSFAGFLLLGLFLSPIISGIVVALLPEQNSIAAARTEGKTRSCPRCGEEIMAVASICKHCQSEIEPIKEETPAEKSASQAESEQIATVWLDWHKRQTWEKAGEPNLKPWIDSGQPDFYEWLKTQV
jgi:hypothetical protein